MPWLTSTGTSPSTTALAANADQIPSPAAVTPASTAASAMSASRQPNMRVSTVAPR